jgi:hypothetical protein
MAGTQSYRTILDYHIHSGTDWFGNIKIEMITMHKINKGICLFSDWRVILR